MAIKLKLLTFRILLLLDKMQRTSKGSELSKKKEWGHRAFKGVKRVYRYKNTHHHCICLYFLLSARARCVTWHDLATWITCAVRMRTNNEGERP